MEFDNRITRMLGVEVPIVQAPMGWIARSQLAAAVSNSGALGILKLVWRIGRHTRRNLKMRQLTIAVWRQRRKALYAIPTSLISSSIRG